MQLGATEIRYEDSYRLKRTRLARVRSQRLVATLHVHCHVSQRAARRLSSTRRVERGCSVEDELHVALEGCLQRGTGAAHTGAQELEAGGSEGEDGGAEEGFHRQRPEEVRSGAGVGQDVGWEGEKAGQAEEEEGENRHCCCSELATSIDI